MRHALTIFAALLLLVLPARAEVTVDLELVLAVDVSLSMDIEEQELQRQGFIAAFRDASVHKAIASGAHGKIAVTYVEWADAATQQVVVPWMVVDGPATARGFADRLAAAPISRARMTSISGAIRYSMQILAANRIKGVRRVIDISGDGPNNAGAPVARARDEAVAAGIVINGLPILLKPYSRSGFFEVASLDTYYYDCVIGGTGSFVIPVRERAEFAPAIRRKLILEISSREPRVIPAQFIQGKPGPPARRGTTDCMIGERLWQKYMDGRYNDP
ncbi:MAG: DUF1194 domain-containing protein [Hyphomicrobiaceae bacterium]